jgi:hypothetical protein
MRAAKGFIKVVRITCMTSITCITCIYKYLKMPMKMMFSTAQFLKMRSAVKNFTAGLKFH